MLSALECVDWLIAFPEDDPCALIRALRPDVLVKGPEFKGQKVPGDDIVPETLFAPEGPFAGHATDMVAAIRKE